MSTVHLNINYNLLKIMDSSQNASPSPKDANSSDVYDMPIVPPQPVSRKECKEVVPDISVVSDVADIGFQPKPNHVLSRNINYSSYQQQLRIGSSLSKTISDLPQVWNSYQPELSESAEVPNCCCSKDQALKVRKSLPTCQRTISSDSGLDEIRISEENYKTGAIFGNRKFPCPKCWKRNCICSSKTKNLDAKSPMKDGKDSGQTTGQFSVNRLCVSSSELSNIWEYLKCQDEKINLMQEKFTVFLSQHASCCHDQSKENAAESDIPYILNILEVHSDKLRELQDQVSFLKTNECKSPPNKINECVLHQEQFGNFKNNDKIKELQEEMDLFRATEYKSSTTTHRKIDERVANWAQFTNEDKIKELQEEMNVLRANRLKSLTATHSKIAECVANQVRQNNCINEDKIRELQNEKNLLGANEYKSPAATHSKINEYVTNQVELTNCVNEDVQKRCTCSQNVEQAQKVTKTSTSTMTSLAFENSDKLVYHKQVTVMQSELKESSNHLSDGHDSPNVKNHLDGKNTTSDFQKRKSQKLKKSSPALKSKTKKNVSPNSSSVVSDNKDDPELKTSHKSERKWKRVSTGSEGVNMRHDDDEPRKNSPKQNTAAPKSHSRSSKQKKSGTLSGKATSRNKNVDLEKSTSSSNTSTDTEYYSPKQRQLVFDRLELDSNCQQNSLTAEDFSNIDENEKYHESITISKYGLSSSNLSVATQRYLENYGLVCYENGSTKSAQKTSLQYDK